MYDIGVRGDDACETIDLKGMPEMEVDIPVGFGAVAQPGTGNKVATVRGIVRADRGSTDARPGRLLRSQAA